MASYQKQPSHNGRFGASGGVSRPTLECRTATSALVQTAVESPACRQAAGTLCESGRDYGGQKAVESQTLSQL